MVKSYKVPLELIALSEIQRASTREHGAPLYLPAFEHQLLAEDWRHPDAAPQTAVSDITSTDDEDDDFY